MMQVNRAYMYKKYYTDQFYTWREEQKKRSKGPKLSPPLLLAMLFKEGSLNIQWLLNSWRRYFSVSSTKKMRGCQLAAFVSFGHAHRSYIYSVCVYYTLYHIMLMSGRWWCYPAKPNAASF